ncbi:MAG: CehA/McbA family metallohydrolase [Actinomycetota bacterium]|nr:CehA/McbA family metallohydrolase [Actinomycetota bacterium]
MTRTEHSGVFTPEDRAASPYRYLPVDVPPGCAGLTVELDYDRSAGVLDLGCFGPNGFRGWSGGARSRYVITPSEATPGYLAGELEPGEWSVALGLHRVAPTGLAWQVCATLGPGEPGAESAADSPTSVRAREYSAPSERPPRRLLPAEPGWRWLAGDLHTHTVHSDGSLTIDELAALAARQGLDFLAVTDHNTISHHPLLAAAGARAGLTLVPGQEVTTHRGHANAFGDIGWVDFREPADAWVRAAAERGGLLSVNHPLASDCAWRQPLSVRPPLAEMWHWTWLDRTWGGPMAWWLAWDPETIPVGGSDFHRPDQGRLPGQPTTWVLSEEGANSLGSEATASGTAASAAARRVAAASDAACDAILAGLAMGNTSISADRTGAVLLRLGDELLAIDADGAILADASGRRRMVRGERAIFPASDEPGPQWLEDDATAVLALCG